MSQQPQNQLVGSFGARISAAAPADTAKTTPISTSDTKPMNNDLEVSTNSSRMKIEANINQQAPQTGPNFDKDADSPMEKISASSKEVPTSSALDESARQQDFEFFRRFLQQSEGATSGARGSLDELALGSRLLDGEQQQKSAGNISCNQDALTTVFAPSEAPNKSASSSIIDQLMPQQSQMSLTAGYPAPLMYSNFGTNFQSSDSASGLSVDALNPKLSSVSSLTFYGDFVNALPSSVSSNSSRMFLDGNGNNTSGGLLDNYTSQLVSSDSSLFGNPSRFEHPLGSAEGVPTKTLAGYQRRSETSRSSVIRNYSSVLNNPAPLVSASIFDVPRQLATNSGVSDSLNNHNNQLSRQLHQQQQQLNSQAARLFGDSLLASVAPHSQQQMMNSLYTGSSRAGQLASSRHIGAGAMQRPIANEQRASAALKRRNRLPQGPFGASSPLGDNHAFRLDNFGCPESSNGASASAGERFSRKVFVGGLPPDIDEEEIKASFRRFGALLVDWPHKAESKSYFPPKGYAFLLFQEEASVQALIDSCFQEEDKLYLCVSSPTIKDKSVQIRPWRLCDTDFVLDSTLALDPRKTVFVGGVPRPLKASELANIMNNLYGSVCYAGIDTDPELKYPKGAGRVAFSSHQSYIAAISARFVHIHHSEIEKRVEVKPYVLDDQFCDECHGARCANKFAPFFCANITCLRYYCDHCWSSVHSQAGREFHKPLVKEGGDRPRGSQTFRW